MSEADWFQPGNRFEVYPERQETPMPGALEKALFTITGTPLRRIRSRLSRFNGVIRQVEKQGRALEKMGSQQLQDHIGELRYHLRRGGMNKKWTIQSFALVREMAGRTIGMRHFPGQLMGGWILLDGMVAELATGEGKTLTATLPASTVALAGIPVHILTLNDYLVRRDAQRMRPLYQALGLTVGVISSEMNAKARRAAYACDVTYCSHQQVAVDYLKDRLTLGNQSTGSLHLQLERLTPAREHRLDRLLLRGLCFAIVDEADSVLIDAAAKPLMLSKGGEKGKEKQNKKSISGQENGSPPERKEILARISYPRFYRRYLRIAGMTGFGCGITRELWNVYRLNMVTVPMHQPTRSIRKPVFIYETEEKKWVAVVQRICDRHEQGQPVLAATRSVEACMHLSGLLAEMGLSHSVLQGRLDLEEAEVIRHLGEIGQVTISVQSALRGIELSLATEVVEKGGLHVMATERMEIRRMDWHLLSLCSRQGDLGNFETLLSLEDELAIRYGHPVLRWLAIWMCRLHFPGSKWIEMLMFYFVQRATEHQLVNMRHDILHTDRYLDHVLAWSGSLE